MLFPNTANRFGYRAPQPRTVLPQRQASLTAAVRGWSKQSIPVGYPMGRAWWPAVSPGRIGAQLRAGGALSGPLLARFAASAQMGGRGALSALARQGACAAAQVGGVGHLFDSVLEGFAPLRAQIRIGAPPTPDEVADAVLSRPIHGLALSLSDAVALMTRILRNKTVTDPVTGRYVVFDDDGANVLLQAGLWEDVAGTQQYRGTGADRRDGLN